MPATRRKRADTPTLDDWIKASVAVATTLRKILDNPKSVTRGEARKALERFERLDFKAM